MDWWAKGGMAQKIGSITCEVENVEKTYYMMMHPVQDSRRSLKNGKHELIGVDSCFQGHNICVWEIICVLSIILGVDEGR